MKTAALVVGVLVVLALVTWGATNAVINCYLAIKQGEQQRRDDDQ